MNLGDANSPLVKNRTTYVPLSQALDRSKWKDADTPAGKGGSPFRGLSKANTRQARPDLHIAIQALWAYEAGHGLPSGENSAAAAAEMSKTAEEMIRDLGVNQRTMTKVDDSLITYVASSSLES